MDSSSDNLISHEYTEVYRRLPLRLHLAYGIGHVFNDICASMWFTYLLVFFHLVLGFDNWQAGVMMLIGQIADALATPFVGYFSDQSDNLPICKYGRRKTWHLIGTLCVAATFPIIFAPCISSGSHMWAQMFYFAVFIIIFQFGWACVQISHLSLIPELTPNEHDRTKLTAVRYGFTVISNLLVYVITWTILHINSASTESQIGPADAPKFQGVAWAGMCIGITASGVFHALVKEEIDAGNDVRASQLRISVWEILTNIKIYQVAVTYMSTRLFVNLSQVFIPLYLHETLNMGASALALIPLIMYIGSFVTSLTIERLNRGLGRKISYIIGSVIGLTACLWIQFRSGSQYVAYEINIIAVLLGASGSIVLVTSLGITADLIGDKTGSGAFIYGIMSFTDKLANGIAVVVIQDLHGDYPDTNYYRNVITYVCGGSALLGALSLMSLIKRNRGSADYEAIPGIDSINTNTLQTDIQPLML